MTEVSQKSKKEKTIREYSHGLSIDSLRRIRSGFGFVSIFFVFFGVNTLIISLHNPFGLTRWPFGVLWWFFPYAFLLAWQKFISPHWWFWSFSAIFLGSFVAFHLGQLYQRWADEGMFVPTVSTFFFSAFFGPVSLLLGFSWFCVWLFQWPAGE